MVSTPAAAGIRGSFCSPRWPLPGKTGVPLVGATDPHRARAKGWESLGESLQGRAGPGQAASIGDLPWSPHLTAHLGPDVGSCPGPAGKRGG